jgi:hypothetical protein
MKVQIALASFALMLWSCNEPKKEEAAKTEAVAETPVAEESQKPIEFADEKFSRICKDGMEKLSAGDVDGFLANFSDDAIYRWNNGDSLAGKPAITKYWT